MTSTFSLCERVVWFIYMHIKWLMFIWICVFIISTENKTQPKIGFICLYCKYKIGISFESCNSKLKVGTPHGNRFFVYQFQIILVKRLCFFSVLVLLLRYSFKCICVADVVVVVGFFFCHFLA